MLAEIAGVVAREDGRRRAPGRRVRVSARDVLRDRTAREEPDRDTRRVPQMRVHTASLEVEAVSERVVAALAEGTARVVTCGARAGRTVQVRGRDLRVAHGAGRTSVDRDLVSGVQVHALCRTRE